MKLTVSSVSNEEQILRCISLAHAPEVQFLFNYKYKDSIEIISYVFIFVDSFNSKTF